MIKFHIYSNDLLGGPVDLSAPIGDTDQLTFACPVLSPGARASYVVRPYDTVTGLEDPGLDARADLAIDASGQDVSAVPPPPLGLTAAATAGGGARVAWTFLPVPGRALPTHFDVWLTAGSTVDYEAAPAATVGYAGALSRYAASLTGLTDGQSYAIGVRARNANRTEANTASVTVVGDATAPGPVQQLTITATHTD